MAGSRNGVRSLDRGLEILNLFSESQSDWTVGQIAATLALPLASAHRLISTLEHQGYLDRSRPRAPLRLGLRILQLSAVIQAGLHVRDFALPRLHGLVKDTGETAVLLIPGPRAAVCVEHVEGTHPIRPYSLQVGEHRPYNAGAAALVLLAYLPVERQAALIEEGMDRYTEETLVSPVDIRARIERIRAAAIDSSHSEVIPGTAAVAAPVFSIDGSVRAAIAITGISSRFDRTRLPALEAAVHSAAVEVSKALGWQPARETTAHAARDGSASE